MKLFITLLTAMFGFAFTLNNPSNTVVVAPKTVKVMPPLDCTNPTSNVEKVVCLANTFKALLTTTQIASLEIAWTTTAQARWSNLPCGLSCRNGLLFSSLSAAQLAAANAVIQAAAGTTAEEGYAEFSQVRAADAYLGLSQGGYSDGNYTIAFLGTPSLTGKWMLQFGGHHYAQNIAFNGGKVIGTTPSHQGVEPLSFTNSSGTFTPLKADHAGMLAMLSGLTSTQLASAKLSTSFSDVSLGPGKDGQFPTTKVGLACSSLTTAQKNLVLAAMKSWTQDADDASGTALQAVYAAEIDATYIAYAGNPTLATNADYVRIDGPSVWIELVCQNGVVFSGIHYHAIYRDHTRDYGASGALTSVKESFGTVADAQFQLGANFPNPFSNTTSIPLTLANDAHVQIKIMDLLGREISTVVNQNMNAGKQTIAFNTNDWAQGSYIYQVIVDNGNGRFIKAKLLTINQ